MNFLKKSTELAMVGNALYANKGTALLGGITQVCGVLDICRGEDIQMTGLQKAGIVVVACANSYLCHKYALVRKMALAGAVVATAVRIALETEQGKEVCEAVDTTLAAERQPAEAA